MKFAIALLLSLASVKAYADSPSDFQKGYQAGLNAAQTSRVVMALGYYFQPNFLQNSCQDGVLTQVVCLDTGDQYGKDKVCSGLCTSNP